MIKLYQLRKSLNWIQKNKEIIRFNSKWKNKNKEIIYICTNERKSFYAISFSFNKQLIIMTINGNVGKFNLLNRIIDDWLR